MIKEIKLKNVRIFGEKGTVPDWPYNFFGEAASLAGRLLRAQRRFRKNRKILRF